MRAWHVVRHGEPADALELVDVPAPRPGAGQVRVRTRAVALNFPDVLLCRGTYQIRPELPFAPGIEACAEVVELGEGVTGVAVGDRVVGSAMGMLAEEAVLPAHLTFRAPPALDDAHAAALYVGYQTAHVGLHRRAGLRAGETLLVHAAAGGVGTAAVQIGKAAGARVIGVVGSAQKVATARAAGADDVVDRSSQDVVGAVKELTAGRGADVVWDPVGGDAFETSTRCVAFEGRLVVVGFASGTIPAARTNHLLVKNYSVVGLHWGLYNDRDPGHVARVHDELVDLAASGAIHPVVGDVVGFADVPQALTELGAGRTVGRTVVTVEEG